MKTVYIRILFWLRGLLSENKIPDSLFYLLKNYVPELSKPIPDLDEINKILENNIGYLNSKEELIFIRNLIDGGKKDKSTLKYNSIKIVNYQDIIEIDFILDRVFTFEINAENFNNKLYLYKQKLDKKNLHYALKLSTIKSCCPSN